MWLLWFCLILRTTFYTEATFGTPYLLNSRLCQPWTCITAKLGLSNTLPSQDLYKTILQTHLPSESWPDVLDKVVDMCYNNRQREYVNTCPSQALLHCTIDNLIENCPEKSWRKNDGCYPVSSLAGTKNMFTQSRYENLEKNLPMEKRPAWFMRNYFSSKCCNLPNVINSTVLSECGFNSFIHYYDHSPRINNETTEQNQYNMDEKDPLQCCDIDNFIRPLWRSTCRFQLTWDKHNRLTVAEGLSETTTAPPTTTTGNPLLNRDVRIVPLSCDEETCVFKKLNIVSESGAVDADAFVKLLDNFTATHPDWAKAKARVLTVCLARANHGYQADCEINKLLACTLDVLTENCPYSSKRDTCRHSRRNNTVCQISSSGYRPKNRRAVCSLPNLVNNVVLTECGLTSVSRTEYLPEAPVVKPHIGWKNSKYACQDSTPSTLCIMNKMGVLNKYSFMDYFKMKDRIRDFTARYPEWSAITDIYLNAFSGMPLYKEHCSSPKKLLNVIDAMLMTCPISKRKRTQHCDEFFNNINKDLIPTEQNTTKEELLQIAQHQHLFLPSPMTTTAKPLKTKVVKKVPLFDFGILNSSSIPPVKIIDVQKTKPIAVILPVYMRLRKDPLDLNTASTDQYKDGVFKSTPFMFYGKIPPTKPIPVIPLLP